MKSNQNQIARRLDSSSNRFARRLRLPRVASRVLPRARFASPSTRDRSSRSAVVVNHPLGVWRPTAVDVAVARAVDRGARRVACASRRACDAPRSAVDRARDGDVDRGRSPNPERMIDDDGRARRSIARRGRREARARQNARGDARQTKASRESIRRRIESSRDLILI